MRKTVKVRVSIDIEVDQEQWAQEFGVDNNYVAVTNSLAEWVSLFAEWTLPVDGTITVR